MAVGEHQLLIDQGFFSALFQLPSEGMTDFFEVPQHLVDEMKTKFHASSEPIKSSRKKKKIKIEYKLLEDVVAKPNLPR